MNVLTCSHTQSYITCAVAAAVVLWLDPFMHALFSPLILRRDSNCMLKAFLRQGGTPLFGERVIHISIKLYTNAGHCAWGEHEQAACHREAAECQHEGQ